MILDVGPPDVGLHVELADQRGQDGTAHLGLGKGQLHPDLTHAVLLVLGRPSIRFMLPERESLQVQCDEAEAGRLHGRHDLAAAGQHGAEDLGLELEPGGRAVVAHPELPEPERSSADSAASTASRRPRVTGVP